MIKQSLYALLFTTSCITNQLAANDKSIDHQSLVESINEVLISNYVFPEIAPKYATRLNQCIQEKCLTNATNNNEVAKKLTKLLQSVHKDKHLNVFAPGQREKMRQRRMVKKKEEGKLLANASGISETKILKNDVGYINLTLFPGTEESIKAIHNAMLAFKNTNAIIFDIREHRGGSPENITEISNFLFQQPTHMVTTRSPYVNDGKPTPHMSEPNQYAKYYKDKPIYLLTSERSGSAAEHFAMSMKATGRAILIGEKTGGYGHWGGIVQLGKGWSMFVPSGRTYHPINKLGWEDIGITPDILVDDEESLKTALKRIKTFHL